MGRSDGTGHPGPSASDSPVETPGTAGLHRDLDESLGTGTEGVLAVDASRLGSPVLVISEDGIGVRQGGQPDQVRR